MTNPAEPTAAASTPPLSLVQIEPRARSAAEMRALSAERLGLGKEPWGSVTAMRSALREETARLQALRGKVRYVSLMRRGAKPEPVPAGVREVRTEHAQYLLPAGPAFTEDLWAQLIEHPDERVPLLLDPASRRFSYDDVSMHQIADIWGESLGDRSQGATKYPWRTVDGLAALWPRLVARAERDAAERGLVLTPLLDAVWNAWEWANRYAHGNRGSTMAVRYTAERDTPDMAALVEVIAGTTDPSLAMQLLGARSEQVRTLVVRHSPAFQDPEQLLPVLADLSPEQQRTFLDNPALRPVALQALRRWAVVRLLRGHADAKMWDELEGAGVGPTAEEMSMIRAALHMGDWQVRSAVGSRRPLAADPSIAPLLLGDGRELHIVARIGQNLHGEHWWRALELLRRSRSGDAPGLVVKMLTGTQPAQLSTLDPRLLVPLLQHDDKEVRLQAARLAGGAGREDRQIPEPAPRTRRRR